MDISAWFVEWSKATAKLRTNEAAPMWLLEEGIIELTPQTLQCDSAILNQAVSEAIDRALPLLPTNARDGFKDFLSAFCMLDNGAAYSPPRDLGISHPDIIASFTPATVVRYLTMFRSLHFPQFQETLASLPELDIDHILESPTEVLEYIGMWGSILADAAASDRGLIVTAG